MSIGTDQKKKAPRKACSIQQDRKLLDNNYSISVKHHRKSHILPTPIPAKCKRHLVKTLALTIYLMGKD